MQKKKKKIGVRDEPGGVYTQQIMVKLSFLESKNMAWVEKWRDGEYAGQMV